MKKIKQWWQNLPNRKPHLDVVIGLLTIPVLLTVVIVNLLSLRNKEENKEEPKVTQSVERPAAIVTTEKVIEQVTAPSCKKEVGPISIESPKEDAKANQNPVCISIKYDDNDYCSVVWSYRINSGPWSDYNSNSVCIYNPPNGKIDFELRVQSTVSQDQKTLHRSFEYTGSDTVSPPPPEPTATPSI